MMVGANLLSFLLEETSARKPGKLFFFDFQTRQSERKPLETWESQHTGGSRHLPFKKVTGMGCTRCI